MSTAAVIVLLILLTASALRLAALQMRLSALERQAVTDPLTGALNRRQLASSLATAVERRRRTHERAALLLLDVDRFKTFNDALGHAEGDRVLKALVALLGQRLRKVDGLFRVGGEEFALLLAGTGFVEAMRVAEDVRALVHGAALVAGREVSISVGVSELGAGQTSDEWMENADAALYRAKRAGRNRVAGKHGTTPKPERLVAIRSYQA